MIPKILHRVVPAQPNEEMERFWAGWQALHPDWEFMSWTDRQNPAEFELGSEFEFASNGAQLADLVRLEVLWRFGGVYLDSDVEPVRPLDGLLNESSFICTEDGEHLTNAAIGCEPQHPAVRACIDMIINERRTRLDVPANVATGPMLTTIVMAGRSDVTVLPPEYFYPYSLGQPRPTDIASVLTPHTLGVHHWAASWVEQERELRKPLKTKVRQLARRALRPAAQVALRRLRHELSNAPHGSSGTYIGNNSVVVRLPDGSPLICLADDLSLTPELVANGIYDQAYWNFLGRHIKPGDRVVEVGANIGLFTVRLARLVGRFGHVTAFEPDPELVEVVHRNLAMNWLQTRAEVRSCAVSNFDGSADFHRNERLRGNGGLSVAGDTTFSVGVTRLDAVLRHDLPIHLVKIDVEGAEADVLEGMAGLLKSGAVRMIDVEVVRDNAGGNWPRLVKEMRYLIELGATASLISADGTLRSVSLDDIIASTRNFSHVVFRFSDRD